MVKDLEKEIPYCTIFLVTGALISHLLVLIGNLQAGAGIAAIGSSTNGWSDVGLGMAEGFKNEIDVLMVDVTARLTTTIDQMMTVENTIDQVISVVGNATDAAGMGTVSLLADTGVPSKEAIEAARTAVVSQLTEFVNKVFARISDGLTLFLDKVEPALKQISKWVVSFGEKLQAGLESFAVTIDKVQKIFDQMMEQMSGSGDNAEFMRHHTFNLFDTDFSGTLSLKDLKKASEVYGITALSGTKSEELHRKYDTNEDLELDKATEYALFVEDESLPKVMSVVLRQYSKILAQVGATVGRARMRDELSKAVVGYLSLVSMKNRTKVAWICQRLTNASIPMAFTADTLKNLYHAKDDPSVQTTLDVGEVVVNEMARINSTHLTATLALMSEPAFFESEGFDVKDQPKVIAGVTAWTTPALKAYGDGEALLELERIMTHEEVHGELSNETTPISLLQDEHLHHRLGQKAYQTCEASGLAWHEEKRLKRVARHEALTQSPTARLLFNELLGGAMALKGNPAAEAAVKGGVPAVPASLEFAKFLAWNASRDASEFQHESFDYSGQSSSPMDAFATQIKGMLKRATGFIKIVESYASERGIHLLREKVEDFVVKGEQEILHVVMKQVNSTLDKAVSMATKAAEKAEEKEGEVSNISSLVLAQISDDHLSEEDQIPEKIFGAFVQVTQTLDALEAILPTCISNLKQARTYVSQVSSVLDSTFATFKAKGKPIFDSVAKAYDMLWIMYFCLLAPITLGILYYGFWASGWFGGPSPDPEVDSAQEEPEGFSAKCKSVCSSCCFCLTGWCGGDMCFWSVLIMAQIGVLLLFLVAILLCILAGVKAFIASGCAQIYLLGDEAACTNTLKMLQKFIETFKVGDPEGFDVENACARNTLMTCAELGPKMQSSAMLTVIGGLMGAIFSFQMLVDSSVLHERASMRKLIQEADAAKAAGTDA